MTPYSKFRLVLLITLLAGFSAIAVGWRWIAFHAAERSFGGQLPSEAAALLTDALRPGQWWLAGMLCIVAFVIFAVLGRTFRQSTKVIREHGQALRTAVHQVESTYDRTLVALSRAIDLRDHETDSHSIRVTAYSLALAAALGIEGPEVLDLSRGALLHDIGKLGIPDSILLKQGPLTPEEWQTMRRHPELGHSLLRDIAYLSGSLPIVLQHHERFDGRGYPFGLHGEDISPLARLFSVADSFDAMTTDRPYRGRLTYAEARAEILRGRGSQFDPAAVDAFVSISPDMWQRLALEAAEIRDGAGLRRLLGRGVASARAVSAVGGLHLA